MKALFLAFVLIASMVFTNASKINAASTDNGLSISNTEVHPGDTFTVSITIPPTATGCGVLEAHVRFDKTKFEVLSFEVDAVGGSGFYSTPEEANNSGQLDYAYADGNDRIDLTNGHNAKAQVKVKDGVSGKFEFALFYLDVCDSNYNSLLPEGTVTSVSVNVTIPATKVSLNKTELTLVEGNSETLTSTKTPGNTTDNLVWKSDNEKVATVDENGKVTAVDVGTTIITATAGNVSATCTVTVTCNHSEEKLTSVQEKASTCKEKGWDAYYECECGKLVASDKQTVLEAVPYRELSGHTLTNHARNEATHATTGNIEYWTCDVCDKLFSDENGKTEIEEKDIVIAVIPHSYATEWSYDDAEHWHACGCGVKANAAAHTFDNACDTTCNDGCGYVRVITHDWETEYIYDKDEHWIECSVCNVEKEESRKAHNGGSATCEKKAVCTDCKQSYGDFAPHNYIEQKEDKFIETPATCMSVAVYNKSCEYCDVEGTDTFNGTEKDPDNHTGRNTLINQKATTCYEKGYTGDSQCECGVIVKIGETIDKIAHTPTEEVKYDDTHHWKECAVEECNAVIGKVELEKAQHIFNNACDTTCNGCGYIREISHTWETEYTHDADEHWIECSVCNAEKPNSREVHAGGNATCEKQAVCTDCKQSYGKLAPHNYIEAGESIKDRATCMSVAVYYKSCEYCGIASETETFSGTEKNPNNHTGNNSLRNAKAATCYEEGYTGDTYCECNQLIERGESIDKIAHTPGTEVKYDSTYHWKECSVTQCGTKLYETKHSFDHACDTTCNGCAYTRTIEHAWEAEYIHDADGHWIECSVCGAEEPDSREEHHGGTATCKDKAVCTDCKQSYGSLADHNFVEKLDLDYLKSKATCLDKAVYYKSCSECGLKGTETFEVGEPMGHNLNKVSEKAPTCEKAGNTAYWACDRCNKYYNSEDATEEIVLHTTVLKATGHRAGTEVTGKKDATCKAEGYTGDTLCSQCDEVAIYGTVIAKTSHSYKDGVCEVCKDKAKVEITVTEKTEASVADSVSVSEEIQAEIQQEAADAVATVIPNATVEKIEVAADNVIIEAGNAVIESVVDKINEATQNNKIQVNRDLDVEELKEILKAVVDSERELIVTVQTIIEEKTEAEIKKENAAVAEKIASVAAEAKATVEQYLDLSILIQARDRDTNKEVATLGTVSVVARPIAYTIHIPDEMWEDREFFIIRVHENEKGVLEEKHLPLKRVAEDTYEFETDKFSTYALATKTLTTAENTPSSPTTGDASNVMLWSLFVLIACGSVIAIIYREKAKR